MDSITQIVLGAAVGEVILGKKLGNKAMLLGGIAGTLPDLDVVTSLFNDDPVFRIRMHRAYSHSMFTHLLAAIPLAWISLKLSKKEISTTRWYMFWFLGLFTHALLDCCTTYGTRLFLPFTDYQVAFNNISVVDPLYTVPFLLILIVAMFFKRTDPRRIKIAWASIFVSSAYMLLTFFLKFSVHNTFKNTLPAHVNKETTEINSTPTILNAILWSGIAITKDSLYVAEYSFLKRKEPVQWIGYPRNEELISSYASDDVKTLLWFADDNYFVLPAGKDSIRFFNVKWGRGQFRKSNAEDAFMFYYNIQNKAGKIKIHAHEPRMDEKTGEMFSALMDRIGI